MGQSLDLTLRRLGKLQEGMKNLWDNIERFHWSHDDYLKYRREILDSPAHKSLPIWAKENLRGYDNARWDLIWRLVVFSYVLGKKRVTIESDAWNKAVSNLQAREKRGTFTTDSGCHVWRADESKIWNNPKA